MNRLAKDALVLAAVGVGAWLFGRGRRRAGGYDFRGKVVLITGGSRGLGLVLARQLAEQGARLALCARDADELSRAAEDVARQGEPPLTHPCAVTEPAQVRELVRQVESRLGLIDVVINDAGVIGVGPLAEMTRQDFEQAMNVNFWGAYNVNEAVLPGMRQRRAGRIVNITSIGGLVAVPHLVPYCASKFALVGYSRGLRAELAQEGIVVTTVSPGLMRTGSPRNALFKGHNEAEYAWFSISDSLPLMTLSAEEAARETLDACRRGDAEAVLSLPAKAASLAQALLPEVVAALLAGVNRLLPGPGGIGTEARPGRHSQSAVSPSFVTTLTERAAEANNEIAPAQR